VAADQAMYRAKSCHKLEKSAQQAATVNLVKLKNDSVVEVESENLASTSVN